MRNSKDSNTGRIEVLEERENPFPDDLEGRLNAITNVVNTELKALTILHLDDRYVDKREIKSRLRDTVGDGAYLPNSHSFGGYCSRSLLPNGVVEGDIQIINARDSKEFKGYRLTEAGKKYGRPIAAFTLDYVLRMGRSMFEIFGSTQSHGKTRAPLTRIKILECLGNGEELRVSDLAKLFQTYNSQTLLNNIKSLSEIGFVDFGSVGDMDGKSFVVYQWVNGKNLEEVKPYMGDVSLTKEVSEALSVTESLNLEEARRLVGRERKPGISNILSHLVRGGFARRVSEFTKDKRSRVRLLEPGNQFLNEWIEPVKDDLQEGNYLTEMQRLYEHLISDEQRFREVSRKGIKLYKRVSPNIDRKPKEETDGRIIKYLRDNPGCRPKEVCDKLDLSNPSKYLISLTRLGILTKKKEGKSVNYFVDETKAREAGFLV